MQRPSPRVAWGHTRSRALGGLTSGARPAPPPPHLYMGCLGAILGHLSVAQYGDFGVTTPPQLEETITRDVLKVYLKVVGLPTKPGPNIPLES